MAHEEMTIRPSSVALWSGILAGPFAWTLAFELKYALVDYACRNHAQWLFWIFVLGGLAICAFGAFEAWSGMTRCQGVRHDAGSLAAPPAPPGPSLTLGVTRRAHFMGIGGLALSAAFALFIIAMSIPDLYLRPCQ